MSGPNVLRRLNEAFSAATGIAVSNDLVIADNAVAKFGTGASQLVPGDVNIQFDATILSVVPVTDDLVAKIGNGTLSMDVWLYGNVPTAYLEFDASDSCIGLFGPLRPRGFNTVSPRFELKWVAGARGKPAVNADILSATEAEREIADPDMEIVGTNSVSTCSAYNAEGGITITTAGASADQVIITPHLDANQTAWKGVTWGTDQQVEWECFIKTNSSATGNIYWCGLKLTSVSAMATNDDQVYFRFTASENSGKWQAIYSISGTDVSADSGVTVELSTQYHLKITIDSSRIARFYINGALVATSTALADAIDLIPYIGLQASTAAARSLVVYGQSISRVAA